MSDYSIKSLPTQKDGIYNCPASLQDVIPRTTSNVLFIGSSGSGKSTLLVNLVESPQFYGNGTFDRKILISPTCKSDDIQKQLTEIHSDDMIDDLKKAGSFLEELMQEQREVIESEGAGAAARVLLIFDDCVADKQFLKLEVFTKVFIASRHYGLTVFICSQSFTQVPRRCRLQAQNIFVFPGSNSEMEVLAEETSPPGFSKRQMANLISFCTEEKFSFMHFNRRVPHEIRYRKNLNEIVDLSTVPR
jgi:hypothetical protein